MPINYVGGLDGSEDGLDGSEESFRFDLDTIRAATNDFSGENKLGQGGFGPVYKVLTITVQKLVLLLKETPILW